MRTMYQMIDEPEDGYEDDRVGLPIWPFAVGLLAAGVVFLGVWLFSPGKIATAPPTEATAESRQAYLSALAAPNAALRRARLLDFQNRFDDSPRLGSVQNQLDVINAAEEVDWAILTRRIYDVRARSEEKLEAMVWYESLWAGALLGGRGDELTELRNSIDEIDEAQPLPDRTLEAGDSPIPTTMPADVLAGGPKPISRAPLMFPPPLKIDKVQAADVVVMPTVKRNVSPRYPRLAQRRKVEGIVVLAFNIDARGRVAMTEVVSIEAKRYQKDFIKAAERAAMKTRFNPKTINGEAVPAVGVRKRYIFRTKN